MNRRNFLSQARNLAIASISYPLISNADEYDEKIDEISIEPKDIILYDKKIQIEEDVFLEKKYHEVFKSVRDKISYVQRHVGFGNFNIISFDYASKVLRYSRHQKSFTKEEIDFIEDIFYYEPSYHGFYGERTTTKLTSIINPKEVEKIPYTGHYLFKGKPKETYVMLKNDIGPTIYLTSGVRSVMKQLKLFLDKLHAVEMNLSKASRSIAPPAFTYHAVGDFDVGKKGLGAANFTERFSFTNEFNQMKSLKYIDMRYTVNNKDGVRYEPWHVKII